MQNNLPHRARRRRAAFTLAEACVAVVIVGVMLAAAMTVVAQSVATRSAQRDRSRAQPLAQRLLAEIMQQPYEQPGQTTSNLGPESGETRATFNDVDDYNGWTESPPADAAGTSLPGFAGWSRSVVVEWVSLSPGGAFALSASETGLKRITVTVAAPSGKTCSAVALRSRQSMYDKQQAAPSSYTSWVGVSLQIGGDPTTAVSGAVTPLNQVP